MTPFDFVTAINSTKHDLMADDPANESFYVPFMTNRSLSYFADTVAMANAMNQYHHADKKLQYHFLLHIIRKRSRFSKWLKPDEQADIEVIKQIYGYSNEKARQVLSLFTPEQLQELRTRVNKGGKQGK